MRRPEVERGTGHRPVSLCVLAALVLLLAGTPASSGAALPSRFSGQRALAATAAVAAIGPRTPGTPGHLRVQAHLRATLKQRGCQLTEDAFTAATPQGAMPMRNFLCRFPGTSGKVVVFSGHYDTKLFPSFRFVGANDAGSSTGLLLEMARALQGQPRKDDVVLVWFDGEEAFQTWSETDSLYGSRHLAQKWAADGTLRRIKALVNVDMIGDRDLQIAALMNSAQSLRQLVWSVAGELGHARHFSNDLTAVEDDHEPFLRQGVPALDLIDFSYGPRNAWWHTAEDTIDKLSPQSFQVVGDVLLETLKRLER